MEEVRVVVVSEDPLVRSGLASLLAGQPGIVVEGQMSPDELPGEAGEHEVLQLLAQGLSNKLIAARLGISDHTVKFHVNAILGKLGAQSRTEAIAQAARLGLVLF